MTSGETERFEKKRARTRDDERRPVWLEATESFYKKLNRIARRCELSRYEALSRGLDALRREVEVKNSALNQTIKSPGQSEVFRRTMGQVSRSYWATIARKRSASGPEKAPRHAGTAIRKGTERRRPWMRMFPKRTNPPQRRTSSSGAC
jgi:hypothetical protein